MAYSITSTEMTTLLGRPLSDSETSSYDNALAAAKSRLEDALGTKIDGDPTVARSYRTRNGYLTLATDPFTGSAVLTAADGTTIPNTASYCDDLNNDWQNTVTVAEPFDGSIISMAADWGFGKNLPDDLARLWSDLFAMQFVNIDDRNEGDIVSEQILTHRVNYATPENSDKFAQWLDRNAAVIAKYARPSEPFIENNEDCL